MTPHVVPVRAQVAASSNSQGANKAKAKTRRDSDDTDRGDVVFSAARKEQRIQKAPGVVTVITAADIKAAGWRDLLELLRFIVGIDVNDNGLSPDIGIRGLNPRIAFGDKLVLLIDGHNMAWRQLNRNSTFIGIDMIQRVEIIRGPGSTLWGANALSGVINIITKVSQGLKGFGSTLGGSPLSRSYFVNLQGGKEILGGLTFRGSFSLDYQNRAPLQAPIYEFQRVGNVDYFVPGSEQFNQYFYGQLSYSRAGNVFNLRFYQNYFQGTMPMSSFSLVGGDDTRLNGQRYITKLSWLRAFENGGTLLVWASYDYYGFGNGSRYEANPLSRSNSVSQLNGLSGTFIIYEVPQGGRAPAVKGYFPLCQSLGPGIEAPCILLVPNASGERVCRLVPNPTSSQGKDYPITRPSAQSPNACVPTAQNGRFTRTLAGLDHRFDAGVQFFTPLTRGLFLNVGLDFEYLDVVQVYSPEIWKLDPDLKEPRVTNYHLSAFAQLQWSLFNKAEVTGGVRVDYDQQYGLVATPRAALVFTPGYGVYGKLLYGRAFKAPSFHDLFYFRKNERYGNPSLRPESVDTLEAQIGWYNRRFLSISVNGYVSFFRELIMYVNRDKGQRLMGLDPDDPEKHFPKTQQPDGNKPYQQKDNAIDLVTWGGEVEVRLYPIKGLNIIGSFGLFLGEDNQGNALKFAARWMGSVRASYRYRFFQISGGALFVGPKEVPPLGFSMPNSTLPAANTNKDKDVAVPSWGVDNDPSTSAPFYVQTYLTVQFLRIFGHLDFILRATNLATMDIYDASDILLMPQQRFDVMGWIRVRY